jgi:transposase
VSSVGWGTVMRAVREYGQPLVDDPARLGGVTGLGVDEHVWQHASARRLTQFATGITDLTPGRPARLLEVLPGRTGKVYAGWLAARDEAWKARVRFAALDPFRGYATALAVQLPSAVRVLDAFHVVKLGFGVVDEVRRRVQQGTLGHRGHKGDPLFEARRVLRRRADRLNEKAVARLQAALAVGDPHGEVTAAWICAQELARVYLAPDPATGRRRALEVIEALLSCPVPEARRLGRTLRSWQEEFLAYFTTNGASNGPTEAVNLIVEKTRRLGHGFRNWENYRLRVAIQPESHWCGVRMKRAVLLRCCIRAVRAVAGPLRKVSILARSDLRIAGPACRLDYRPDVLIMVACARSATRACRGGYPRGGGRAARRQRPAARGHRGQGRAARGGRGCPGRCGGADRGAGRPGGGAGAAPGQGFRDVVEAAVLRQPV